MESLHIAILLISGNIYIYKNIISKSIIQELTLQSVSQEEVNLVEANSFHCVLQE